MELSTHTMMARKSNISKTYRSRKRNNKSLGNLRIKNMKIKNQKQKIRSGCQTTICSKRQSITGIIILLLSWTWAINLKKRVLLCLWPEKAIPVPLSKQRRSFWRKRMLKNTGPTLCRLQVVLGHSKRMKVRTQQGIKGVMPWTLNPIDKITAEPSE